MPEQTVANGPEFARNGEVLHGKIAVASLARLRDALYSDDGALEYTLTGYLDEKGRAAVRCTVRGMLELTCQRCLNAFAFTLDSTSDLLLVEDEKALEVLNQAESDPPDAVLAAPSLDVAPLVEDEVLLALPMFPRHPEAQCALRVDATDSGNGKDNAFAALAALQADHRDK